MKFMRVLSIVTTIMSVIALTSCATEEPIEEITGLDERVTYIGRTDFSTDTPRQYASGAYFTFAFEGNSCEIDILDENLYGENYNYLSVVVDGQECRVATYGVKNRIIIGKQLTDYRGETMINTFENLANGYHTVMIVRDTETGMGYTALSRIRSKKIQQWNRETRMNIEFIGNSITCGAESYLDEVAYGSGTWFDRHYAYKSYGVLVAQALNADWMLTSVSGIGLIHSCCDMEITMPQVYDKIALSRNQIEYDFSFLPNVICVCLGQNDGIQDDTAFTTAYVDFIANIRMRYPTAKIILLTSPMAGEDLSDWMKQILPTIALSSGDDNIYTFAFSRSYNSGGGDHPDVKEHEEIAAELITFLKRIL